MRALSLAKASELDDLAIDALHMMAFVDTEPDPQLRWGLEALAFLVASTQPQGKKWKAHCGTTSATPCTFQKRYEEAVDQFRLSLEARRRDGSETGVRVATRSIGPWVMQRGLSTTRPCWSRGGSTDTGPREVRVPGHGAGAKWLSDPEDGASDHAEQDASHPLRP
jgi:hypothetical protein